MTEDSVLSTKETRNRYELIIVVAREARRLNDRYRYRSVEPKARVTTEAIKKAVRDGIAYRYGHVPSPLEKEPEAPLRDVE
jgi:hypothetical protein